ncbi:dihydrodipicolinate synthase family protein [Candidatus Poribacteria bacterium]|nr:dihydrodipicolinate synthase family protein [Candidatus Poribacteria bacterium]
MFPQRPAGVFPPIVTPLDEREGLEPAGFEAQLERLIAAGVHGIYLLGSSGEWVTLREDVRDDVVRTAVRLVNGRVPIICCVMDTSTERVLDNAARVRDLGVEAIATTPPFYYMPFANADLIDFYERVAHAAGLPTFIYNIPSTTKVMIPPEVIEELADLPNIVGIKDSSGNWIQAIELIDRVGERDDFVVFLGSHVLAGGAMLFGAKGAVMSLANIDPRACCDLFDAAMRRDIDAVHRIQRRLLHLGSIYKHGREIPCMKTALELMGVCGARATHPMMPVSPEGRTAIADILRSLDLL